MKIYKIVGNTIITKNNSSKYIYTYDNKQVNVRDYHCVRCNNYIDFMNAIQKLRINIHRKNIEMQYSQIIDGDDNKLLLFITNKNKCELKIEYRFETSMITTLFYNICRNITSNTCTQSNTTYYVKNDVASRNNYMEIGVNYYIMYLLLCTTILKSRGEKLYFTYNKKKKSGGYRTIVVPQEEYKAVLREIDKMLQLKLGSVNNKFQVAYKKGKSIFDNALPHANNNYTCCIDLHDFYGSCKRKLVYDALKFMKSDRRDNGYELFIDALLRNDALFMGNPCSGTIANYIISKAVAKMYVICKKTDIALTVYADDITFSSTKPLSKKYCIDVWNKAFKDCGIDKYFTLSEHKCHCASNKLREITGVRLNHLNQITVKRKMYNYIKIALHRLQQNKDIEMPKSMLRGNLSYMYSIDRSGKFIRLLTEYRDVIINNNIFKEETVNKLLDGSIIKLNSFLGGDDDAK